MRLGPAEVREIDESSIFSKASAAATSDLERTVVTAIEKMMKEGVACGDRQKLLACLAQINPRNALSGTVGPGVTIPQSGPAQEAGEAALKLRMEGLLLPQVSERLTRLLQRIPNASCGNPRDALRGRVA